MTVTGRGGQGGRAHDADEAERASAPRLRKASQENLETAARARVLVLDDEPLVLKSFERLFGREHAVTVSSDAKRSLAQIELGERYDVIVCDLMMPDLSGKQFHAAVERIDP